MAQITIYEAATGRIDRNVTCGDAFVLSQLQDGEAYIDGSYDDTSYFIDGGQAVRRTAMALTNNGLNKSVGQVVRIDNIPAGTIVQVAGNEVVVDDGFIEWTSVVQGTFTIRFDNHQYLEERLNAIFTNA